MLLKIKQAAAVVGLSEYALRRGISEGRYPHIRTSGNTGKIFIDIDLLEQYLKQEAASNITPIKPVINYRRLRRVVE